MPTGLSLTSYGPRSRPEVLDEFRRGHLWEELRREDSELANATLRQSDCLVLRGEITATENLNYLRDTVGLIAHLAESGAVSIYDPLMFRWWSAQKWRDELFAPNGPVPRHHTAILVSEEISGKKWFHTRGMRKFARPDISVHNVSAEHEGGVNDLCNRLIEFQALGGLIPEGQEVRIKALPDGGLFRHGGHIDDPDFNNVHIEAYWPDWR